MEEITVPLSRKGIADVKKFLLDYKNRTLPNKISAYVKSLSELGLSVIDARLSESPIGSYVQVKLDIEESRVGSKAIITSIGEVKEGFRPDGTPYPPFNLLLAIEFGSGIYYNPVPNPNAEELGFGVGSFPGQIHAFEDGWYYWDEKDSKWKYTHGIRATMPMYSADIEMIQKAKEVAIKTFSS